MHMASSPAPGRLAVSESACPLCQRPLGLRPRVALGNGTQVHEKCQRAAERGAGMSGMMQDLHQPADHPYCSFSGADVAALESPAPHDDAASFHGAGVLGDGPGDGEEDVDVLEKASTASTTETFMAADGFNGSADECVFKMDDQSVMGGGECEAEHLQKRDGSPAARRVAPAAESESTTPAAPPPATPSGKGRSAEGGASGCVGAGIHPASLFSRQHADKRTRLASEGTSAPAASADGALPGDLPVLMHIPV